MLGSDETDGMIEEDSDEGAVRSAAGRLLEKTQRLIPAFPGRALLDRCWSRIGVRAVPSDGDTIAGPLSSAEGLHIVCTHSGVTLGPAIARWTADSVETGEAPAAIAEFGLDRFQM